MDNQKQVARRGARQAGLTLLEIMIVLAIIALIMGVLVGPKVMNSFKEARIDTAFITLKQEFMSAHVRWVAENEGDCPEKLEDLLKYTNRRDLKDPWGSLYVQKCGDEVPGGYGVISLGPDKKEGTEDDIHSWDARAKKL
jgi:general secretion pathway protein G